MYFVVNQDLNMGKGKTAAQVAHAATMLTVTALSNPAAHPGFKPWYQHGQPKIVLKATQTDFDRLAKTADVRVVDAGRTQVDPHTTTVLGWFPAPSILSLSALKLL